MVELVLLVSNIETGTSIAVIPQYSFDGVTFYDQGEGGQFDTVNSDAVTPYAEALQLHFVANYFRVKKVVVGGAADVTFSLSGAAKK
jgi:hypothetical protein